MNATLRIVASGKEFTLSLPDSSESLRLSEVIYLSGLFVPPVLCSGLGHCSLCRVRFVQAPPPACTDDLAVLGEALCKDGWRLGCKHLVSAGMWIELPSNVQLVQNIPPSTHGTATKVACDYGSTTLHFSAIPDSIELLQQRISVLPFSQGDVVEPNPQSGAGGDIISRLAFAAKGDGAKKLQELTLASIKRVLSTNFPQATKLTLAANPAMLYILLGKDTSGLAHAPYSLDYSVNNVEKIQDLPQLWCSPCIAPFVGGDISAGYAALALNPYFEVEYPFVLADLGTNGEFVLAVDKNTAFAISLPLGPALEGCGFSFGSSVNAAKASVSSYVATSFSLSPNGLQAHSPAGELNNPSYISGTGYISLIHQLFACGVLDKDGHFATAPASPPYRKIAEILQGRIHRLPSGEKAFYLNPQLYLSATDVEEFLKVKAAFRLALEYLFKASGLSPGAVKDIYIAGAMGQHTPFVALGELGFVPTSLASKIKSAGNSSLAGAMLLAAHPELDQALKEWCAVAQVLEITADKNFMQAFAANMRLGF